MPADESNRFLRAALNYAKRGWRVFPCEPGGKKPLVKHGFHAATTDERQIREWWDEHPDANIGVPTGEGFFVVDIDPRAGGNDSVMDLYEEYGAWADTLCQTTGGDGQHRLYLVPEGVKIPCVKLRTGIEIKGEGGYIIVAPSVHASGKRYEWDCPDSKSKEIRAADPWLAMAIIEKAAGEKNGALRVIPPKIPEGERNDWLWQAATSMRHKGFNPRPIFAALLAMKDDLEKPEQLGRPGYREYCRDMTERVCRYPAGHRFTAAERNGREAQKPEFTPPAPMTLDELMDADVPAPEALIENLLPRRGVALMAGSQRTGKTIFAAQTALALASNRPLLDFYRLNAHGPVIVIEKDDPGANAGFKTMFQRAKAPRGLAIDFYDRKRIPEECVLGPVMLEWLARMVAARCAVMVVLDSLTALRAYRKPGADVAKEEYDLVSGMDALAKDLGFCILLLHHVSITVRANGGIDWDAQGAGSFGLTAAAEGQVLIARYRDLPIDAPERHLRFRGSRQMKEHEATFAYNPASGLFQHVVDGSAAHHYESLHDIKHRVEGAEDGAEFHAKDLEEPLGVSRNTAFRIVSALTACGALSRFKGGTYRLSPEYRSLKLP